MRLSEFFTEKNGYCTENITIGNLKFKEETYELLDEFICNIIEYYDNNIIYELKLENNSIIITLYFDEFALEEEITNLIEFIKKQIELVYDIKRMENDNDKKIR